MNIFLNLIVKMLIEKKSKDKIYDKLVVNTKFKIF